MNSLTVLGDAQMASGTPAEAAESFRRGADMAEAAAKARPDDLVLLQDLWIWWDKVANARRMQGEAASALSAYERCLSILFDMIELDSANAGHHFNLAVGHWKLGLVLDELLQHDKALAAWRFGRAIAAKLTTSLPNPQFRQLLATFDQLLRASP